MSKTISIWRAIGLWFVAGCLALLVGGSFYRLWEGIQAGSGTGIRRGLMMVAVYGGCFLCAMLGILLNRRGPDIQSAEFGSKSGQNA
jgi:hypothetical protein